MHSLSACCLAFLAAVLSWPAAAAPIPDFASLDAEIVRTKTATGLASGTAVVAVHRGRIVYEGYFGHADLAARRPVDRDTVFYIASATKPFFALDTLLLEAAGKIDTRISLRRMFPDTAFPGVDAEAVTLRDLLVHASGVSAPELAWAAAYGGLPADPQAQAALVAAARPDPEAGHGRFRYTNAGYNIASVWMDRVLGTSWRERLGEDLFGPLGMRRTRARIDRGLRHGGTMALPYTFAGADPQAPLPLRKTDATLHAAGGMVSTAADLARFLLAQLAHGDALPPAVVAASQAPQVAVGSRYLDFARDGYAWGWYTGPYRGRLLLHHFGGFAGFHAHLSFMPAEDIGLVVLNNEDVLSPRLSALIADRIYGDLLGEAGNADRVAARFAGLRSDAAALAVAAAGQRAALAARRWTLSLPHAAYAGRYVHPLLGEIRVTPAGNGLRLRRGTLAAEAGAGLTAEQVRVEWVPGTGQFADFVLVDGRVTGIEVDGGRFLRSEQAGAAAATAGPENRGAD